MTPRAGNLFFNLAQPERAEDLLDEALRSIDVTPPLLLVAWGSCIAALRGRSHQARAAAEQVLNSANATSVELCVACWGALAARSGGGDLSDVDTIGRRAQEVAAGASLPLARVGTGLHWLRSFLYTGELDRAEELMLFLKDAAADSIGLGTLLHEVMAGQLARERGLVRTAARLLRRAGAGLRGHSPAGWAYYVPMQLTPALAMTTSGVTPRFALDNSAWMTPQPRHLLCVSSQRPARRCHRVVCHLKRTCSWDASMRCLRGSAMQCARRSVSLRTPLTSLGPRSPRSYCMPSALGARLMQLANERRCAHCMAL